MNTRLPCIVPLIGVNINIKIKWLEFYSHHHQGIAGRSNVQRPTSNNDEFVKSRIHQVFGVSCLVFGMKYMMLYWYVRTLNTKHQIQNTLAKSLLF